MAVAVGEGGKVGVYVGKGVKVAVSVGKGVCVGGRVDVWDGAANSSVGVGVANAGALHPVTKARASRKSDIQMFLFSIYASTEIRPAEKQQVAYKKRGWGSSTLTSRTTVLWGP